MIPSSAWVTNEYDLTLRLIVTILRVKMAILWGKIIILRGENEAYRSKWVLIMQFGFGTYFRRIGQNGCFSARKTPILTYTPRFSSFIAKFPIYLSLQAL